MIPTGELLQPEVQSLIHAKRFRELRDALDGLAPADVADLICALEPEDAAVMFRLLRRAVAGDALAELDGEHQQALVENLTSAALRAFVEMGPDDRADLIEELPPDLAKRIIASLSPEERKRTQTVLGYPHESVGRLMTPDYVRVRPEWTVARAMDHLRKYGRDTETVMWVYIIDDDGRLIDDVHLRTFILADPDALVRDLMDDRFLALRADDDQEEAVATMARYDRSAMPVVDSKGVLVGIVTYDDVADVAEEEATEDIQKLAGVEALDDGYMSTRLRTMIRKRGGWLGALFALQVVTIAVLDAYENELAKATALIAFIPLIISCGGNTGTQAASLLIRAIALREVRMGDWHAILRREFAVGLVLGLFLGVLAFGVVLGLAVVGMADAAQAPLIGLAVAISVVAIVVWAVVLGSMSPLVLNRFGVDPASISSPLVATLMDVSGLVIYLTVAFLLLGGAFT